MQIEISMERALSEFRPQVDQIIAQLRKGKSKNKNANPEDLSYKILWSERIEGNSFADIVSGKAMEQQQARYAMSVEDRVQSRAANSFANITGKIGRWRGTSDQLETLPQDIVDQIRKVEEEQHAERERINNLSPEERQAEINDALDKLSGRPGFMGFIRE